MEKIIQMGSVVTAGVSIAFADSLIKKSATSPNNLIATLFNPLMLIVVFLYLFQIALLGFVYVKKWDFSITIILEIIISSTVIIIIGNFVFHEKITLVHQIGIFVALIGAILMNI